MPALDTNIKEDLIECRNSFFIPYKKNYKNLKNVFAIISEAPKQLNSYQRALEKSIAGAPEAFPVYLTPEEIRLRKESVFSMVIGELSVYLNEVLSAAVVNYGNKVTKPLKESLPELRSILARILGQIKTKPVVIQFSKYEITALNDLLKIISEQIEDFEKGSEEFLIKIALVLKQSLIKTEIQTKVQQIKKSELLERYNRFLLEAQVIISRIYAYIANITKQINILDAQTANLIKALQKAY